MNKIKKEWDAESLAAVDEIIATLQEIKTMHCTSVTDGHYHYAMQAPNETVKEAMYNVRNDKKRIVMAVSWSVFDDTDT